MLIKSEEVTLDLVTKTVIDGGALSDLYHVKTLIPAIYILKSDGGALGTFNAGYEPLADLLLGPVGGQLEVGVVNVEESRFRKVEFSISAPFIQHFVNDLKLIEGAYVVSDYKVLVEEKT